ncbi:DUF3418 domain-containing protein [Snodgrassella gandavensis]|nr:DUF3418 domain-containing protein [Snodgrassella gandavensis]
MPLLSQLDIEQRYTQQLPAHCYLNIQVLDDSSTELASGHNLNSRSQQFKQARGRQPAITEDANLYALPPTLFYTKFYSHQSKYPLIQILRPHRNSLIYPGCTSTTYWQQWSHLPVYLQTMLKRMDKYDSNPVCDAEREADIQTLIDTWQTKVQQYQQQNQPVPTTIAHSQISLNARRAAHFPDSSGMPPILFS